MSLDNLSLKIITDELKTQLIGSTFGKPMALTQTDFAFPYSEVISEGNIRHGTFIFSLNPVNPFVCYSHDRYEKMNDNTPFFNSLKKMSLGKVTDVKKHEGERILTIFILADKSDISETNESYDFVLELFPNRPNCYIIAYPYGKIVSLYKEHTDIEKGIFITRNVPYNYPPLKECLPSHLNDPEEARPYLPNMTLRRLKDYVLVKGNDLDQTLKEMKESKGLYVINKDILSFDFKDPLAKKVKTDELYSTFVSDQKDLVKKEKIKELVFLIEKAIKTADKKLSNLKSDLKSANDHMVYLEYGQMIYLYQCDIKKGDTILEKDGYKIPLNPRLDAVKNANNYFKKYSKSKAALNVLGGLIDKTNDEIVYLKKKLIEVNDGTPRDIMELKSELLEEGYIRVKTGRNTVYKVSKKHKYEPHYLLLKEGKIGFGMNGLQNEELTFDIAKKDDLFFHVKDYPGSHVVILDGDSENLILTACELSLYLSKLDNGIVMKAKRKDVKKNPNHIGLVNILKYETLAVKYIRPESLELFKKELKTQG